MSICKNLKHSTPAFSLFEIIVYLMIVSILSLSIIKPKINHGLAIRQASAYIQRLQKILNDIPYETFKSKKQMDKQKIIALLHSVQTSNRFFTLTLQNNNFLLTIYNKTLKMGVRENLNGSFSITCNPREELCRKLYHRKMAK